LGLGSGSPSIAERPDRLHDQLRPGEQHASTQRYLRTG
jgi:hypothetical protein